MKSFKHIKIPEDAQSEVWKSIPDREEWKVPDAFFEQQAQTIVQAKEVLVPDAYFEKSAAAILAQTVEQKKTATEKGKLRWINWVSVSVAAAAVIGAVVLFYPKKEKASFADLLQKSELSDEEIIEEVSTEEMLEVFPEDIEVSFDTLINGLPADTIGVPTDTLKKPIKPLDKKALPKWDDISTEEIIEFLMENGDDDLFN